MEKLLKGTLLIGAAFFLLVTVVHQLGFKIPGFYVYYDISSTRYQDKIISVLAFGWATYLFVAFLGPQKNSILVWAILLAGAVAILGLVWINLSFIYSESMPAEEVTVYWVDTIGLGFYWLCLLRAFRSATRAWNGVSLEGMPS